MFSGEWKQDPSKATLSSGADVRSKFQIIDGRFIDYRWVGGRWVLPEFASAGGVMDYPAWEKVPLVALQ